MWTHSRGAVLKVGVGGEVYLERPLLVERVVGRPVYRGVRLVGSVDPERERSGKLIVRNQVQLFPFRAMNTVRVQLGRYRVEADTTADYAPGANAESLASTRRVRSDEVERLVFGANEWDLASLQRISNRFSSRTSYVERPLDPAIAGWPPFVEFVLFGPVRRFVALIRLLDPDRHVRADLVDPDEEEPVKVVGEHQKAIDSIRVAFVLIACRVRVQAVSLEDDRPILIPAGLDLCAQHPAVRRFEDQVVPLVVAKREGNGDISPFEFRNDRCLGQVTLILSLHESAKVDP